MLETQEALKNMEKLDKNAIYLLAVAALKGAKKYYEETPDKPNEAKKSLPSEKKKA